MALGLLVLVLTLALIFGQSAGTDANTEAFNVFWSPVFQAPGPLLLAAGHPLVYHPSARALKLNEEHLPQAPMPMQRALQLPPGDLSGSDMVPVFNQYVGFGDMVAATEVATMLGRSSSIR